MSFFCVFRFQLRDFRWPSLIVKRDIYEIGSVGVRAFARNGVFGMDVDFRFHGGAPCVCDYRVERDQVANLNGFAEGHRIDGDGHDFALGVAHTSERARLVREFHDPAAVHVAQQVGMFEVHELRQGDARCADGFGRLDGCHSCKKVYHATGRMWDVNKASARNLSDVSPTWSRCGCILSINILASQLTLLTICQTHCLLKLTHRNYWSMN